MRRQMLPLVSSRLGRCATTGTLQYIGSSLASTDRVIDLAGTSGGAGLDSSGTAPISYVNNFTASGSGAKSLTLSGSNIGNNIVSGVVPDSGGGQRRWSRRVRGNGFCRRRTLTAAGRPFQRGRWRSAMCGAGHWFDRSHRRNRECDGGIVHRGPRLRRSRYWRRAGYERQRHDCRLLGFQSRQRHRGLSQDWI